MWKNTWLKELAGRYGLEKGKSVIVEERSLLKDYTYITRKFVMAWCWNYIPTIFTVRWKTAEGNPSAIMNFWGMKQGSSI